MAPGSKPTCKKNTSRDAHSFINRWGLAWKVPFSHIEREVDGELKTVPFLKPTSFVKYLLERTPDLLFGGCPEVRLGQQHLKTFWEAYSTVHPSHRLFAEQHASRALTNTVALCLHGDEGRGLKKSNTTVIMLETCLGLDTHQHYCVGRSSYECGECELKEATAKKFRTEAGFMPRPADELPTCFYQRCNLRHHAFLTKFVLAVVPMKEKVVVEKILTEITRDMICLFEQGVTLSNGQQWYGSITGLKGDLKWYQHIGGLERCFSKQLKVDEHMCHECLAGTRQFPFEDASDSPAWSQTLFKERPFSVRPVVCHIPFERDVLDNEAGEEQGSRPDERMFRRDIFHNTKMGVFRDFVASVILLMCKLKYFNEAGTSNKRDILIARAHARFHWFCKTTGRTASLRCFSEAYFNVKSWSCFPWASSKGSDTSHLLAWVHVLAVGALNDPLQPSHKLIFQYIASTAAAARSFTKMSYSHGLWFHPHCARVFYQELHKFLQGYNSCAFLCLNQFHFTGFAFKSKYHMVARMKYDTLSMLQAGAMTINPQVWGCEANEDVIGQICRLGRRVDTRNTSLRTLQLYLAKSKALHRRFRKQKKIS